MKTLFAILALALLAGCGGGKSYVEPKTPVETPTAGTQTTIGGVTWATANVDVPGTFASRPGALGKLYKWGGNVAWSTTDPLVSTPAGASWDDYADFGWSDDKNPCPTDWRLPTRAEMQTLASAEFKWGTLGGVRGASFKDRATGNSIFLPASYGRDDVEPFFDGTGAFASYWTASESQEHPGNYLLFRFSSFGVGDFTTGSAAAFAVRCVKK